MRLRLLSALFAALLAPGCVMVQIGVTNPIPGLTTVAVAPFINLSAERAVDGRQFALTYASELQKVPGFEVIPVGVTEIAMKEANVDLNDVDDVLKLAKTLRVDAVVVGAITEYSPYYPPRIGMQVSWYSPKSWSFYPGIQIEPAARAQLHDWDKQRLEEWREYQKSLDEAAAPETPVWGRMYHCFKRLPGIRTLYGEPSLSWNDGAHPILWRAQSPSSGVEPSAEPAAALPTDSDGPRPLTDPPTAPLPLPLSGEVEKRADAQNSLSSAGSSSADEGPRLVKVAHYQELEGMPAVVRLVTASDANSRLSGPDVPPPPAPEGSGDASPADDQDSDPESGPGSRDNQMKLFPTPLQPRQPGERGMQPGLPLDTMPFGPEPPQMTPVPLSPRPLGEGEMPPVAQPLPMRPIRDPALAPCPPQPNPFNAPQPVQPWQSNPRLPLMAYTRLFDGADGDLVAALRDYVELNGDLRSGGWEAYLHRSEDYIRFTSYRMILEMLSLHGGEGKHRMIFKLRKYR